MDNSSQSPGKADGAASSERRILDSQPTGILITRITDGIILLANRAIGKMLAVEDVDSIIGSPVPNFYWDADERQVIVGRFQAEGLVENYEMRARRVNGDMFWVSISLQPFRFEGEQTILSTIVDITEKKVAEQEIFEGEKRLQALFNAIPRPVIVTSLVNGNVLYANQHVSGLIGLPADQIVGNQTPDFYNDPVDRQRFVEALQKVGYVHAAEIQVKRSDGLVLWAEITVELIQYAGMPATIAIIEDISDRKQAQEMLRVSEERFRDIVSGMADWIWEVNAQGSYTYCTDNAANVLGYEVDEILGKTPLDFMLPEEVQRIAPLFSEIFAAGKPIENLENWNLRKDGTKICLLTNGVPMRDEQGNLIGYRGVDKDITQRKMIEIALQQAEAQSKNIIDALPMGMIIYHLEEDGRLICTGSNPAADKLSHMDTSLYIGKTLEEAFPHLVGTELPEHYREVARTGVPWQTQQITYHEGEFKGAVDVYAFQTTPNNMVTAFLDISDRFRVEQAVNASREQLSDIIDFLPDATFVIDKDRKVIAWNHAIEEMTGIPKEEIIGKGDYVYAVPFYGDARPILIDHVLEPKKEESPGGYDKVGWLENILTGEVYVPGVFKGRGAYLYATASPLYNADGKIIGAIESIRDITERKEIEILVQENEARFRALFEKSADAILILENGTFTDCNQAAVEMMRSTDKAQFLSLSPSTLSPEYQPDGRLSSEKADEMIQTALTNGVHRFEWIHRRTDGTDFPVEVLLAPILLEGRDVLYSVWRDIAERKKSEAQLQQEKAFSDMVINSLPGVFYMLGTDGKFLRWNENMENVLGYSSEELAEMTALDCFAEDERPLILGRIQEVFVKGSADVEGNFLTKAGDKIPYSLTGRQVLIADNPYLLGVGIDVSERKYLETQLQQSSQRRGYQVQLSTEISQEVASSSDLSVLVEQVVVLIKERLEYYHTQLLRYDPTQDAVVLIAGYGETGAKMLALNHRMPMGQGLIGLAAQTGETVVRSDLAAGDPNWQPNPLLPETRGEIAVPIKLGQEILGVLDVQSAQAGAIDDDDRLLLEGLCGQIAIAMDQTRLRAEMSERLEEINTLYRTMSSEGWDAFRRTADLPTGFQFDPNGLHPLPDDVVVDTASFSIAPLSIPGGTSVGTLALLDDPNRPLTREDQAFLQQISEQVALALESARLFAQTQYTLGETEALYGASARLNTARTYDEILNVLRQNTILGKDSQNISMNAFDRPWTPTDTPEWIDVLTRWSTLSVDAVSDRYPLAAFPSAKDLLSSNAPTIIEDVIHDPRLDVNARALYANRYGAKSTIFVPLVVGGLWIGYINAVYQTPTRFPEGDVRRLLALSGQAAVAINNQRLFEETQSRANRERSLREVTTQIRASANTDTILRTAVRELGRVLGRETFVQIGGAPSGSPAASSDDGQK